MLGSGGPRVNGRRASSGYLVWVDGVARGLVDAGGGAFVRLGQAGVTPAGLDFVLLTHTHIDHTGGLAPLVFAAWMAERTSPLAIVGPSGREDQPGCRRFCDLLFGPDGAWNYLHTFEGFGIDASEVPEDAAAPVDALGSGDVAVRAVGVPHGMMPAVAFRVDHAGRSITFSGDVSGRHGPLTDLARGCDLLIHDQALPRRDLPHGHLHAPPEETGATAAEAGVRTLLLSHFLPPAESAMDVIDAAVRQSFAGQLLHAVDLMTVEVSDAGDVVVSPATE